MKGIPMHALESQMRPEDVGRGVLENTPDAIIRYDLKMRRVYANRRFEELSGLTPEQYLYKTPSELSANGVHARELEELMEAARKTGAPQEIDFELRVSGGHTGWYNFRIVVERDARGQPANFLCIGSDISARKWAEQALAASERQFRSLAENAADNIVRYDLQGRILYVNANLVRALRTPASAMIGRRPIDFVADGGAIALHESILAVGCNGESVTIEHAIPGADGFEQIHQIRLAPERDHVGAVVGVIGIGRDITERKRLDDAWHFITERGWGDGSDLFFPALVRYIGKSLRLDYVFASKLDDSDPGTAEQIASYARGELTPNLRYALKDAPCEMVLGRALCSYPNGVQRLFPRNRKLVDMQIESYAGVPLLDATGRPVGLLAVMDSRPMVDEDLVLRVLRLVATRASAELLRARSEQALQASEREFRSLAENSPDVIVRYDRQARLMYANPSTTARLGVPLDGLIGLAPSQLTEPGQEAADAEYEQTLRRVLRTGEGAELERTFRGLTTPSEIHHVHLVAIKAPNGNIDGALAIGRDITQGVEQRARIKALALSDPLTRLHNRQALYDCAPGLISEARRHSRRLGVMVLDLDRFKDVNDMLGHAAGDALLREVAQRIANCTRGSDLLVRLGGDEFAIVATNLDESIDMATIASKIHNTIAAPLEIGGRQIVVNASVGIALFPGDGEQLEDLLAHADMAMYHAKRGGRNRYEFYRAEFSVQLRDRLALEHALRDAQDGMGLELHYQPLVACSDGHVVGAEALLRWRHPELGLLGPDRFIALAEDTGLIVPIGRWVIAQAACKAWRWNQGRATPLKVAVNVSTRQFLHDDVAAVVRDVLCRTGCQPQWLGIEVTESLLLDDSDRIQRTFRELRRMGLEIAIDDFGTGYSALNYLSKFDVTCLKIDRQFVRDIDADPRQAELVKAFISIARSLNMSTVAEGVETSSQASFLLENGCDVGQGYLYSRPVPAERFEQYLGEGQHGQEHFALV
jgi:diguanylate cyclase (GGDEF)-like protein/PAS domain S-box-containing protein